MNTDSLSKTFPTKGKAFLAWAELTGLWAIIVTQQSLDRIASGPEAFTRVGADRIDVVILVIAVAFIVPSLGWAIEMVLYRLLSPTAASNFHSILFGGAVAIFWWQFAVRKQMPTIPRYLPSLLLFTGAAWLYARTKLTRSFGELLSLSTPIVIVLFLLSYPTSEVILPAKTATPKSQIKSDTPVVLIIFDEFPLYSLLDRNGEIDAKLFPNFAKLAHQSTWYPDARANGPRTIDSLPAIMGGITPADQSQPPLSFRSLPDNLCSLMEQSGYRVHAVEQVTDYCGSPYSRLTRLRELLTPALTGAVIPPNGMLPKLNKSIIEPDSRAFTNQFAGRAEELDRFIETSPTNKGSFQLAHILLPHQQWVYQPDGYESSALPNWVTWVGPTGLRASWFQQHMLQVGFVDRELGNLISSLKEKGVWQDALIIVTADHGINFTSLGLPDEDPVSYLRKLTPEKAGTLLPIPLFIKYPDQMTENVDSRPASLIDILPTILKEIGMSIPAMSTTDGTPLQDRKTAQIRIDDFKIMGTEVPIEKYTRARDEAVRLRNSLFGDGSFFALAGEQQMLGHSIDNYHNLTLAQSSIASSPSAGSNEPVNIGGRWEFVLQSRGLTRHTKVVVAVNHNVAATVHPWFDSRDSRWKVSTVLPNTLFATGTEPVSLYLLRK